MIWEILQNESGTLKLIEKGSAVEEGWNVVAETANPNYLEDSTYVPKSVTMRQGRLALLSIGLLDMVESAIDAIPDDTQRKAAKIEWEYAQSIDRDSAFVQGMAYQLGMTDQQMDQLFIIANGI